VLGWTEDDRAKEFQGSALKRSTLAMMKRNALIAAGNAIARRPDEPLLARIREIANDSAETELVRETAHTVLSRLGERADIVGRTPS
jgi:epoxyqueuosine reductase QueG